MGSLYKKDIMDRPYVVGMDMGGTNTVFGIVDTRGNVITKSAVKTAAHSDILLYVEELYKELMSLI